MESLANSRKIKHISFIEHVDMTDVQHKSHQVSKSLRNLFMKLKGTSQTEISPLREMKRTSLHSKNYQLPVLENDHFSSSSNRGYRHTMDFSHIDSSSLCNSSIYYTFTSSPLNHKSSHISLSSTISSDSSCMKNENNENIPLFLLTQGVAAEKNPYLLQKRLWDQDTTLCPTEQIAEFLGQNSPSRSKVLYLYMSNFDFYNQKLDPAFRTLCSKLYLKAETQQIDRIIKSFANRYYECNPNTLFLNVDVIHTVAYSMLLLNTDLHVANEKMTKSSFVKNTMETIQLIVFPHLFVGLTRAQKHWLAEIESTLKDIFLSVKSHYIDIITPPTQQPPISVIESSIKPVTRFEGYVMRKHVMESTEKRARHRHWQPCYLVITDTHIVMYKPKTNQQQQLTKFQLNHIYATAVPHPQRPHVFRLETADGGLWLFETSSTKHVKAWVNACHLAAAKISKGLLSGAVSNMEYGWGGCSKKNHQQQVSVWYPPSPCMINSQLSLDEQYRDIEHQIQDLNQKLDEHRKLKFSVDRKFGYGNSNVQAQTNWDRKLHYILHELIKLGSYKDALLQQVTSSSP